MSNEQGVQMGLAMKAIINLHQDSVKLISDIDKHMQGFESFYGNVVTQGLGSSISNRKYIADGLMRHYHRAGNLSEMLGVNVCFYDLNDPNFAEPILVVARTTYVPMDVDYAERYRRAWDPWYSFLSWAPARTYGEAISLSTPKNRETIVNLTVAALPLYEVKTLAGAVGLIELVGMPQ